MQQATAIHVKSGDTYTRNREALRKANPGLAARVDQISVVNGARPGPKHSGLPNIPLGLPRRPWYYYDNSSEIAATAELIGLDAPVARVAIFLGFGLGYQLTQFARAHANRLKTERIVIVEKNLERFRLAMETTELAGLLADPRITFLVDMDDDELFARALDLFRNPAYIVRLPTLVPFYHPGDLSENSGYYISALRQIREAATEAAHLVGNSPEDSLIGLRNMLANLRVIADNPGIDLLRGAVAGRPAIIVSTGPSLNKNIDQLRDLQHRALLVAVDASVAPLTAAGVKPHLVVSLERVPEVANLVEGFDLKDSYFAACPVVRPETYTAYRGPILVVYRDFGHFAWLQHEKGTLPTGPSAANMAFKIAEYVGADPIILVGQDLAFGDDGSTHAQHAVLGQNQEAFHQQRAFEVPGNLGGTVKTSEVWMRFLKHFRADVHGFKGTCINATEGGALIPGTHVMPLQEAAERFMRDAFDAREVLRERLQAFRPDPRTREYLADKVVEGMQEVEEIIEHCHRGADKVRGFIAKNRQHLSGGAQLTRKDRRRIEREVSDLFRLRVRVEQLYPRAYQLLMGLTLQPYLVAFEQRVAQLSARFPDRTLEQIAWGSMHLEWFTRVAELSRLCLQELEKVDLEGLAGSMNLTD